MLDQILRHKQAEVAERREEQPLASVRREAEAAPRPRDFLAALIRPGTSVIAEIKRQSPSRGVIRRDVAPAVLAAAYTAAGARAISVLTDRRFFGGSAQDLAAVRAATELPLLRKDFVVDEYQVWEARALGADAVLLIVRAVAPEQLASLLALAERLEMAALVEVHDEEDARAALAAGARLVGINNRDLATMVVDLSVTRRLRPLLPAGVAVVAESGVRSAADLRALLACPVDAVLIGEAVMAAADPARALRELLEAGSEG
ncbi:MAG: indole-3-glycerol phosphate synthase TrpC [Chloroflexota bacterium]